jgi:hypothetical protein
MSIPAQSATLDELLAAVAKIAPGAEKCELWVPASIFHQGEPISLEIAMTIVLDRLLSYGMFPDGFVESENGRTYLYHYESLS